MIVFDARAAKTLAAGNHLTFDAAPGLRLKAGASKRTWIYRYKSLVDARMRQARLGQWPAMSATAALVAWQQAPDARASGTGLAARRESDKVSQRERAELERREAATSAYTVRRLAEDHPASYGGTVAGKTFV